ncbi:MAG: hypothetical protein ACREJN_18235 [Nitrospiraceae bacterium]
MPIQGNSSGYNRPEGGWRFNFQGMKTNTAADEMVPTKYPYAQNVRYVKSLQTRPGYTELFTTVPSGLVLSALLDGVEILTASVATGNPLYIASGLPDLVGVNNDAIDWGFDNWANGDGTTDLFTDDFNRGIAGTLGANWTQSDIGGLATTFRINGNRLKGPTKATTLNLALEVATPVSATSITDQHCALQTSTFGGFNSTPVRLGLRANGTAIGGWIGYLMLFIKTGVNEPDEDHWIYDVDICHFNQATATLTVLNSITDQQMLIGSTPTFTFKAIG